MKTRKYLPNKPFKIFGSIPLVILLFVNGGSCVHADVYFNPRFLSDDPSNVADLSSFEKGLEAPPGIYRVDMYINEKYLTTRDISFEFDGEDLTPCLSQKQLSSMGVNTLAIKPFASIASDNCILLSGLIKDAYTHFDVGQQRLYINIPQAYMRNVPRGYIEPELWDNGINAGILNYNLNGSSIYTKGTDEQYAFLNLQTGLNLGDWRLRDNSTWSYLSGNNVDAFKSEWKHVNTYLERDIESLRGRLTIGDGYTPSEIFDGINFRGIQFASNDKMLPESQQGFAPVIRGIAKGAALVSVKQNGYEIFKASVPAGPFIINDLYSGTGSGDLEVTVKEADGSAQVFTVPYSFVPLLQREGSEKYAVTLGEFRSGSRDQENPKFFQGTAQKGMKDGWTLYGGTQISDDYQAFQLGAGKNLGRFGAVSTDITHADAELPDKSKHQGNSIRFMYNKSLNDLGTNIRLIGYRYSTQGYFTISDTAYRQMKNYNVATQDGIIEVTPQYSDYYNLAYTKRGRLQLGLVQQISPKSTMYLTGSHQTYWGTTKADEQIQIGYTASRHYVTYNLSYSLTKSAWQDDRDEMLSFGLNIPFGQFFRSDSRSSFRRANLSYGMSNDMNGRTSTQAGMYGTLLASDNLSYSMQTGYTGGGDETSGATSNLSLNYRAPYGDIGLGFNYTEDYKKFSYGLTGGILIHSDGITLSQPMNESVVLIRAAGAKGVDIENHAGVRTDQHGFAVLPYAVAYRENRVALNTDTLPTNIDLDEAVTSVVPTQGAVVLADFKTNIGVKALVNLLHDEKPVPFGAMVTLDDGKSTSIVSDDGQVYLTGLPLKGKITAKWGESTANQCSAEYELPIDSQKKNMSYLTTHCK